MKRTAEGHSGLPSTASPLPYLGGAAWSAVRFLFLLCMAFIILYPLVYMLSLSIHEGRDVYDMSVVWIPRHYTLDNFKTVFGPLNFAEVVKNSGILGVTCTVLSVFVCSLAVRLRALSVPRKPAAVPCGHPDNFDSSSADGSSQLCVVQLLRLFGLFRAITGHATNLNLLNNMGVMMLMAALGQGLRAGLFIFIFRQYYKGRPERAGTGGGDRRLRLYGDLLPHHAAERGRAHPYLYAVLAGMVLGDYYTLSTYLPDVRIVSSVRATCAARCNYILAQDALDPYKIITIEQAACIASVLPLLCSFSSCRRRLRAAWKPPAWSAEYGKEREQICAGTRLAACLLALSISLRAGLAPRGGERRIASHPDGGPVCHPELEAPQTGEYRLELEFMALTGKTVNPQATLSPGRPTAPRSPFPAYGKDLRQGSVCRG